MRNELIKKFFYRPLFDRRLVVLLLLSFFTIIGKAEETDFTVEMELKADPYASYKQRRTDWSKRVAINYETFYPENYISSSDGSTYQQLVSSNSIQMTGLSLGTQYNTRIGGLYFDIFLTTGSQSGTTSGSNTTIGGTKTGASIGLFLDTLFENPYISPYLSYQIFSFNWFEASPQALTPVNLKGTIDMMSSYQFGFALHLDKIDPISSGAAYAEYGLKNSFLDLYGTQTMKSSNSTDPNFSTAFNWGMAFRVEF